VEVLSPMLLKEKIREKALQTVENNTAIENDSEYKFKVYKK
jgi:hypothetical protein